MQVSIIVPVFNSSKILPELVERIYKEMKNSNLIENFELILINDYSLDDSWNVIKEISKKYSFLKGINLSENFGQHNAIMAGLNNSKGNKIITIDDDLQHPPEFISEILKKLDTCEVCYTNYKNRKHAGWKRAVSSINNIVSSFLLNKPLKIYMSSFRGINKIIVNDIVKFKEPDVYIDGLIIKYAKKIDMINVDHNQRKLGESNYTVKKLLILWSSMIINFSVLPFRASSIFGLILKIIIRIFRKKSLKPQYKIIEIIKR